MASTSFIPALWKAIGDRLIADTTLLGLLASNTSIYNFFAPAAADGSAATMPYIVFKTPQATPDEGLRLRQRIAAVEVHIYVAEQPQAGGDNLGILAQIIDRVEGDWPAQAGGINPSYGLERWLPVLASPSVWTTSIMDFQEWRDETLEDGGTYHVVITYQVRASVTGLA